MRDKKINKLIAVIFSLMFLLVCVVFYNLFVPESIKTGFTSFLPFIKRDTSNLQYGERFAVENTHQSFILNLNYTDDNITDYYMDNASNIYADETRIFIKLTNNPIGTSHSILYEGNTFELIKASAMHNGNDIVISLYINEKNFVETNTSIVDLETMLEIAAYEEIFKLRDDSLGLTTNALFEDIQNLHEEEYQEAVSTFEYFYTLNRERWFSLSYI